MIRFVNVTHHYGVRPVLRRFDLTIEGGQTVALMGPNGAGKSTLLRLAAGQLHPLDGTVEIGGMARRASVEDEPAIRRRVSYLPDQSWLPKQISGRAYLVAIATLYGAEASTVFDRIDRLVQLLDLEKCADASIGNLSRGELKKLAVCGALVPDTPVLLLDEPFTGGLDPSGIVCVRRYLAELAATGEKTILMATQMPEIAETLAAKVAYIEGGRLLFCESPRELRDRASGNGHFGEALERLTHPETLERFSAHFEKPVQSGEARHLEKPEA